MRRLLAHERVVGLRRQGITLDAALNIIWLAEAHDALLPDNLHTLMMLTRGAVAEGTECRLHLVVLLPDLTGPPDEGWKTARQVLRRLEPQSAPVYVREPAPAPVVFRPFESPFPTLYPRPDLGNPLLPEHPPRRMVTVRLEGQFDEDGPVFGDPIDWPIAVEPHLPTRVWLIGRRNRADLHLQDPLQITPLIQHIVEASVTLPGTVLSAPASARDWASPGLMRLELVGPTPEVAAARVWEAVKLVTLSGPPPLPTCPGLPAVFQPAFPNLPAKSCQIYPNFPEVGQYRSASLAIAAALLDRTAELTGELSALPGLAAQAVQAGAPRLLAARRELDTAFGDAKRNANAALEVFDAAFGVAGSRRRRDHLRLVSPRSHELPTLEALVNPVDDALSAEDLDAFVERDLSVRGAETDLANAQMDFVQYLGDWQRDVDPGPPSPTFTRGQRFWVFLPWSSLRHQLRAAQAQRAQARQLICAQAHSAVSRARDSMIAIETGRIAWARCYAEYLLLSRWRDVLRDQLAQIDAACLTITSFQPPIAAGAHEEPLVLRFPASVEVEQAAIDAQAESLARAGLLELVMEGNDTAAAEQLLDVGRRLTQDLDWTADWAVVSEDTWQAVALGSAPRVAALENAQQATTRVIIGQGLASEPLPFKVLRAGLPNEALMLQVLHPLNFDDLLGLTLLTPPRTVTSPGSLTAPTSASNAGAPGTHGPSSDPIPASAPLTSPATVGPTNEAPTDDRPNSLLDEVFA